MKSKFLIPTIALLLLAFSFGLAAVEASKFTAILPPKRSYTSLITGDDADEENLQIEKWRNFTLTRTRVDEDVPSQFAPENPEYFASINKTYAGITMLVLAILGWTSFGLFMIIRFGLGKHAPLGLFVFGCIIFLTGSILNMVGTLSADSGVENTAASLDANGESDSYIANTMNINISLVNAQMTQYTNGENKYYLGNNVAGQQLVKAEADRLKASASTFGDQMRSRQAPENSMMWMFFIFGLVAIGVGAFAFAKKVSSLVLIFGLLSFGLVGASWFTARYYHQQQMYYGDICIQVEDALQDVKVPKPGTGISKYINCFSSDAQIVIGSIKQYALNGLYDQIQMWKDHAEKVDGANATQVKAAESTDDIGSLVAIEPYSKDTWLTGLYEKAMVPTYWVLSNSIDLSVNECRYLKQWTQDAQLEMCAGSQEPNWTAYSGAIVIGCGYLVMAYGLIAAKNVFDRIKELKETMISRSDLNDI